MSGNVIRKRQVQIPRRGKTREAAKAPERKLSLARESASIFLIALGCFLAAALYSYLGKSGEFLEGGAAAEVPLVSPPDNVMGVVGEYVAAILVSLLGWCSFITVLWAILLARRVWTLGWPNESGSFGSTLLTFGSSIVMVSAASAAVAVLVGRKGGGLIGGELAYFLVRYLNEPGALLVSVAVFVLALGLSTGLGSSRLLSFLRFVLRTSIRFGSDAWFSCSRLAGYCFGKLRGWLFSMIHYIFRIVGSDEPEPLASGKRGEKKRRREEVSLDVETDSSAEAETEVDDERPVRVSRRALREKKGRKFSRGRELLKTKRRSENGSAKRGDPSITKDFDLPPIDLLVQGEASGTRSLKDDELIKNSRRLEKTLQDFRVAGRITEVQPGPVITLYHFEPAAGMKVQRIVALADDIALALKVASVRVYAPVPGKGTVGIEVPNAQREIVRLRDLLASEEFHTADSPLVLALGKDTLGDPYVADLTRMPHLLIAGATGTGKSVCINAMLLSLIYRHTPETLRLILIDPKMLELSIYDGIPHLKAPVVTNPKRARGVLWWAVEEMDRRYRLMQAIGVRNLASYNRAVMTGGTNGLRAASTVPASDRIVELTEEDIVATGIVDQEQVSSGTETIAQARRQLTGGEEPLPRIVIVVDELADLMLTVGREIEELLTRLAQKARASGIHLILATQRPSVNVITGLIKANFPARISFQVASRIDARTVMDSSGAEKLLGQGDMLFLSAGTSRVRRLHGAFVSDKEVQDVVEWVKQQRPPDYDVDIEKMITRMDEAERSREGGLEYEDEYDPLYDQAVRAVIDKEVASTSMIQRLFRIGYNRAARILEAMEREGIVGPQDGAKPRQVYVPNRERFEG